VLARGTPLIGLLATHVATTEVSPSICLSERRLNGDSRLFLHRRYHVLIDIHREENRRVPERLAHHLGVDIGFEVVAKACRKS
jgi:hypothetical protein